MKTINCQCCYRIPSGYPWIARNQTGVLNGFMNPPIRDFRTGEWQDSVTGDYGFFIPFDEWEKSVREVSILGDCSEITKKWHKERQKPTKGYTDGRKIRSNYTKNRKVVGYDKGGCDKSVGTVGTD